MSLSSAVISPARWRTARRARHQERQRKADASCDQQRAERILLHFLRHGLRTFAEGVAAVLISVLGVADGGIGGFARGILDLTRGILGLAVQILHRACRLAGAAGSLGFRIAGDIADRALDFTGDILCRAYNSVLVHRALLEIVGQLTDETRSGS